MTLPLLKGALAGGLVLFAWSAIAWMVLPWHEATLKPFPNEPALRQALSTVTERAIYLLPDPKSADAGKGSPAGPMVIAAISPGPIPSMGPQLIVQFGIQVLAALLATWLFLQTRIASFGGKILFFAVLGLIIGAAGHLPHWNWFGFSSLYTLSEMIDLVIGYSLAGAAISKLAK